MSRKDDAPPREPGSRPVEPAGYDGVFQDFDSPSMREMRAEAYGEDIGQHSWVTAQELRDDIRGLGLTAASRVLDLGCGPCGPLTFVVRQTGCQAVGIDVSDSAIAAGRARVAALGLEERVTVHRVDLNEPLPLADASRDAVLSLDVILHLRDRSALFREVARVLVPGGKFLFTDAAVVTGAISDEDIRRRAVHGYTQFVPSGFNEQALERSGLRLMSSQDRTAGLLKTARGRLAARRAHRAELEAREGRSEYERQDTYLETVIRLADSRAVSRMMYVAAK